MKLGEIINSVEALNKLIGCEHKASLVYKLYKIITILEPEIQTFNKVKDGLIKKYGVESDGNIEIKDKESIDTFNTEILDVLNQNVDINFDKIKLSDIEDVKMSLDNFTKLKWLIEDNI